MKAENKRKILEFLEESVQFVGDVLFMFSQPYGTSSSRMDYLLQKRQGRWSGTLTKKETRLRFNDLVYRLKKDGLVCKIKKPDGYFLQLTKKGKRILETFRADTEKPLPDRNYESAEDNILKIVIFDIPENERNKRDWLRSVLKNLKFKMLQRSVWAGKRGLPEEFLADLEKMNLLPFVEIFSVNKKGSLVQILEK